MTRSGEGRKKEEYRKYNDYYIERCTYEEDGRRYLVPFDALVLYQGKRAMTVSLKDITCDGKHFVFHLGEYVNRRTAHKTARVAFSANGRYK